MSAHTAGPWEWDGQILVRRVQPGGNPDDQVGEWDEVIFSTLDDLDVAKDFVDGGGREYCNWSCNAANARLIAAAPELLEAGIALVERWDTPLWKDVPHTAEFIARLRAAIAKAQP